MPLEKPFIHSSLSEGDHEPINYNEVFTFRKTDQSVIGVAKPLFYIEFDREENSVGPKTIIWKYIDKCTRNTEYDKIIAMISKPIV